MHSGVFLNPESKQWVKLSVHNERDSKVSSEAVRRPDRNEKEELQVVHQLAGLAHVRSLHEDDRQHHAAPLMQSVSQRQQHTQRFDMWIGPKASRPAMPCSVCRAVIGQSRLKLEVIWETRSSV